MIVMTLQTRTSKRTLKYKTLLAAQKGAAKAIKTMGAPRKDPDGYAVGPTGDCLHFTEGCSFETIFPARGKL